MFNSGINKQRKFERRHYYLPKELVLKIEEIAKDKQTTRSKIVSKILKEKLDGDKIAL